MYSEIKGLGLNYEAMDQDQWTLYFNPGTWLYNNQLRTLEPAVMRLDPSNYTELMIYNVYYSGLKNLYYIVPAGSEESCTNDLHLGGFMIKGCDLTYIYPDNFNCEIDGKTYIKTFNSAFNRESFLPEGTTEECGDTCQSFNNDFSSDFMNNCEA